ncbi:FabD/lysophospholipase-like protein [Polychaeton citri CBS 116435]|uniref:FabD/lysophospholipase-like protein n=1 Tax=Polychaeton citri CBS 116435 TaxID=1314669 RepID=A0A9P4UT17_9PEZI|nr:FabD/lysophospholipase-like protein [Polychaeton citri CBS 116435]
MDEASRLRRKDTTKGPPLRILSLDGGGVRGYSIFIILQELMHRTFVEMEGRAPKRHEIPKPCDHFDLIAGTGTGGLIAIMLGRLRLDIDTCKDVYVRMTRRVFETDKTFAGIPYRSTLFKASKLEEAIRECVREHTVFEDEGNDSLANATPMSSAVGRAGSDPPESPFGSNSNVPRRTLSQGSRYSNIGMSPTSQRSSVAGMGTLKWGNPNALLYDTREHRTKTAVTAVYKGTPKNGRSQFLRSYDSRKEPAPDVNCTIWQAGRATSATGLAFKPIQIGQSVYIDEGAGKFNPAPQILDEAISNEWPGRELGVFVSIGTGKRPGGTGNMPSEWWEGFLGGTMGDFAEARRRLASKIEGCEDTHQYMLREYLAKRGVNVANYYRLNVEIGVGEFGMNEWARLSDISTNTRMYLAKNEVQTMNLNAAAKMAKIHFAKIRWERAAARGDAGNEHPQRYSWQQAQNQYDQPLPPASNPTAIELPGDDGFYQTQAFRPGDMHRPSIADQKYIVVSSDEHPQPTDILPPSSVTNTPQQRPTQAHSVPNSPDLSALSPSSPAFHAKASLNYHQHRSHPSQYQQHYRSASHSSHSPGISPRVSSEHHPIYNNSPQYPPAAGPPPPQQAPPIPPKTPLPYPDDDENKQRQNFTSPLSNPNSSPGPRTFLDMGDLGRRLPYPDIDLALDVDGEGPPPKVNMGNKPQVSR